jgi:hypothetical protein
MNGLRDYLGAGSLTFFRIEAKTTKFFYEGPNKVSEVFKALIVGAPTTLSTCGHL